MTGKNGRCYFKAYVDWENAFVALNNDEIANIFKALFKYAKTGEKTDFKGNERFIFPLLVNSLDNDQKVYDHICEQNRANGSMGGRPKKENRAVSEKPSATEKTQEKRGEERRREEKKGDEKTYIYPAFAGQEFIDAFEAFEEMRRMIKKPMTDRAKKIILNKLERGAEKYRDKEGYCIAALNRSIENNWTGVYEPEDFEDHIKVNYDPGKLLDDYNAYCDDARKQGIYFNDRMSMEEFFKGWIKENEQRSGDGGDRLSAAG